MLHKSDTVAHLAIDLLRKIKEEDQKIKEIEQLTQKGTNLQIQNVSFLCTILKKIKEDRHPILMSIKKIEKYNSMT